MLPHGLGMRQGRTLYQHVMIDPRSSPLAEHMCVLESSHPYRPRAVCSSAGGNRGAHHQVLRCGTLCKTIGLRCTSTTMIHTLCGMFIDLSYIPSSNTCTHTHTPHTHIPLVSWNTREGELLFQSHLCPPTAAAHVLSLPLFQSGTLSLPLFQSGTLSLPLFQSGTLSLPLFQSGTAEQPRCSLRSNLAVPCGATSLFPVEQPRCSLWSNPRCSLWSNLAVPCGATSLFPVEQPRCSVLYCLPLHAHSLTCYL